MILQLVPKHASHPGETLPGLFAISGKAKIDSKGRRQLGIQHVKQTIH